jgi:hypothetical protein
MSDRNRPVPSPQSASTASSIAGHPAEPDGALVSGPAVSATVVSTPAVSATVVSTAAVSATVVSAATVVSPADVPGASVTTGAAVLEEPASSSSSLPQAARINMHPAAMATPFRVRDPDREEVMGSFPPSMRWPPAPVPAVCQQRI